MNLRFLSNNQNGQQGAQKAPDDPDVFKIDQTTPLLRGLNKSLDEYILKKSFGKLNRQDPFQRVVDGAQVTESTDFIRPGDVSAGAANFMFGTPVSQNTKEQSNLTSTLAPIERVEIDSKVNLANDYKLGDKIGIRNTKSLKDVSFIASPEKKQNITFGAVMAKPSVQKALGQLAQSITARDQSSIGFMLGGMAVDNAENNASVAAYEALSNGASLSDIDPSITDALTTEDLMAITRQRSLDEQVNMARQRAGKDILDSLLETQNTNLKGDQRKSIVEGIATRYSATLVDVIKQAADNGNPDAKYTEVGQLMNSLQGDNGFDDAGFMAIVAQFSPELLAKISQEFSDVATMVSNGSDPLIAINSYYKNQVAQSANSKSDNSAEQTQQAPADNTTPVVYRNQPEVKRAIRSGKLKEGDVFTTPSGIQYEVQKGGKIKSIKNSK